MGECPPRHGLKKFLAPELQTDDCFATGVQGRRKRYGRWYGSRHTNPKFGMATPYQSKVERRTFLSACPL